MANFTFHRPSLVVKRLPQTINRTEQIVNFDLDNVYPQRMKELATRSPLTKQAIDIQKDFFNGEGFEQNEDLVINSQGWTVNDLLHFVSSDYSLFMGFGIFFNFDGRGLITEALYLPFEYIRFGMPDEMGVHTDVKVSNNWEQASLKLPQGSNLDPIIYPLFNPELK